MTGQKKHTFLDPEDLFDFDNRFVTSMREDPIRDNFRRQVPGAVFSKVVPKKASTPELVAFSKETADLLGLPPDFLKSRDFTELFSGSRLLDNMIPFSMNYGGHQFGNWAGQLGDGRAINLGEINVKHHPRQTLQLKGAGPTPYSRSADGLAVLRSSIREFLCSEAMAHLGIPTTRALSIIKTGDPVLRDMLYDGHPRMEPGAVVCRVAPSFIRFGHFELFASRRETGILEELIDYTIQNDFPDLGAPSPKSRVAWFEQVCEKTCELMVHWMRTGFVHGVMNTDNMSILGLTIDYGPYGWLEDYNPAWTPNTTDAAGRRYCYGNQPAIGLWNLVRLGNAVYPVIKEAAPLQEILNRYDVTYQKKYTEMMLKKLGLIPEQTDKKKALITDLTELMALVETDMTLFFRMLSTLDISDLIARLDNTDPSQRPGTAIDLLPAQVAKIYYITDELTPGYLLTLKNWFIRYRELIVADRLDSELRRKEMDRINPLYVLRNYLAQQAIEKAEQKDYSMVHELLDLIRRPYEAQPGREKYALKRPEWARNKPGCSMLSCSS